MPAANIHRLNRRPCSWSRRNFWFGDGSRVYVGLENGDAVDVIDTAKNEVIAHAPVGQAPQVLIYVPGAVAQDDGHANLAPRPQAPANGTLPH